MSECRVVFYQFQEAIRHWRWLNHVCPWGKDRPELSVASCYSFAVSGQLHFSKGCTSHSGADIGYGNDSSRPQRLLIYQCCSTNWMVDRKNCTGVLWHDGRRGSASAVVGRGAKSLRPGLVSAEQRQEPDWSWILPCEYPSLLSCFLQLSFGCALRLAIPPYLHNLLQHMIVSALLHAGSAFRLVLIWADPFGWDLYRLPLCRCSFTPKRLDYLCTGLAEQNQRTNGHLGIRLNRTLLTISTPKKNSLRSLFWWYRRSRVCLAGSLELFQWTSLLTA